MDQCAPISELSFLGQAQLSAAGFYVKQLLSATEHCAWKGSATALCFWPCTVFCSRVLCKNYSLRRERHVEGVCHRTLCVDPKQGLWQSCAHAATCRVLPHFAHPQHPVHVPLSARRAKYVQQSNGKHKILCLETEPKH